MMVKGTFAWWKAEPFWPARMECFATDKRTGFWWRPGWHRSDEAPLLTAYAGAGLADRLADLGDNAAIQIALDDLTALFGERVRVYYAYGMVLNWAKRTIYRNGLLILSGRGGWTKRSVISSN